MTAPGAGKFAAQVYAVELMGDHSLVTCRLGEAMLTVKADKGAALAMDAPVGVDFDPGSIYIFDSESGERLGAAPPKDRLVV